jgi:hypothetical protein
MSEEITTIPVAADAGVDEDEAELAAMGAIAMALKPLTPATRRRVIEWAAGKYGASPVPQSAPGSALSTAKRTTTGAGGKATGAATRKARRKGSALPLDKTLDVRPKGVQSFADFVAVKNPQSTYEENLVTVYWMSRVAGLEAVTADQVYTCYKDRGWRVPADLRNHLQMTASSKAWLDTSNMDSIKVTIGGENYVEHDLPAQPKAKS